MNYSEMTDFEINCEVARKLGFIEITGYQYGSRKKVCFADGDEPKDVSEGFSYQSCDFNPCNSWADAGPIIQVNQINLNSITQGWIASDNGAHDCNYSVHEHPLRAAMIVFLMMQESEK